MAVGKAINQRKEIAMPPADYVPHPELAASVDYQIAQQQAAQQVVSQQAVIDTNQETVREVLSRTEVETNQEEQIEEFQDEPAEQAEDVAEVSLVNTKHAKSMAENMRALREKNEQADRENKEMRLQMLEMQARQQQQQYMPKQEVVEVEEKFNFDLDEDSLVEGKQLKKMAQEMFEMKKMLKSYEKQTSEIKRQSQEMTLELKLKSQYPDFNKVFNSTNIDQFKAKYPDIAQSISYIPGDYEKSTAAYTMMKNLGFGHEQEVSPSYEVNKQKAAINSIKPRPATSTAPTQGGSPLSRMNGFIEGKQTKEAREQAWAEVEAARRR